MPGSMFSFTATNVMYVSLLCASQHLLGLINLNSNDAQFLAYINSKYVTWFLFPRKVVLIPRQTFRRIAYNRAADWNWPGISRRHNKGGYFCFLLLWNVFVWYVWLGVSFQYWNLERYNVSYIGLQQGDSPNEYSGPNSSGWLPFKVTFCFKRLANSSWKTCQRHNLHSRSVCLFFFSDLSVTF